MASLPSVVVFAYNYHDERLRMFRLESFDSEGYIKSPFFVTRKSSSKPILQWHNDKNYNRRTATIEYETNIPRNDLILGWYSNAM